MDRRTPTCSSLEVLDKLLHARLLPVELALVDRDFLEIDRVIAGCEAHDRNTQSTGHHRRRICVRHLAAEHRVKVAPISRCERSSRMKPKYVGFVPPHSVD